MTKNTYNPYEIMMDKYDKEEMLSDVREAMLYQLGVDVSCEELDHFFTDKGNRNAKKSFKVLYDFIKRCI